MSVGLGSVGSETNASVGGWHWPISHSAAFKNSWLSDAVIILASAVLAGLAYDHLALSGHRPVSGFAAVGAVAAAIFVPLATIRGLYETHRSWALGSELGALATLWLGTVLFLLAIAFAMKVGAEVSRGFALTFTALALGTLCAYRMVWRSIARSAAARNLLRRRPACLITSATDKGSQALLRRLGASGYNVTWCPADLSSGDHAGLREVVRSLHGTDAEEVLVSCDLSSWLRVRDVLRDQPLPVCLVPDPSLAEVVSRPVMRLSDLTLLEVQRGPLSAADRRIKRALDLALACSALVLLVPVLALVALVIKLDSGGPVLFQQFRRGFNGKPFKIYKFRTMTVLEDGGAVRQASRNDLRVTKVGWWLRRTSIDELPQLLNVIRGEMSVVGPRPHALAHDNYYVDLIENYAFRHHVKPGITGWAQVKGCRGETPNVSDMERRVEHDIWYVDNCGPWLDLLIIFRTVIEVARTRQAY